MASNNTSDRRSYIGNAVVPQVAAVIGQWINEAYGHETGTKQT